MSIVSSDAMSLTEALIGLLSDERQAQGMSQAELARKAGMSKSRVRRTLHGDRTERFSTEDTARLSVALGLDPFEVMASPRITVQQIRKTGAVLVEMGAI